MKGVIICLIVMLFPLLLLFLLMRYRHNVINKRISILLPSFEIFDGNGINLISDADDKLRKKFSFINKNDVVKIDFNYLYGDKSKDSASYKRAVYIKNFLQNKMKIKKVYFMSEIKENNTVTVSFINF